MYNNAKKIVCSSTILDSSSLGIFIHYISDDTRKKIIYDLQKRNDELETICLNKSNRYFNKTKTHYYGLTREMYIDLLWQNDNLLLYVKQLHYAKTGEILINNQYIRKTIPSATDSDIHTTIPDILKNYIVPEDYIDKDLQAYWDNIRKDNK